MAKCKLNPDGTTICSTLGKIIRPYSYNTRRYCSVCAMTFETMDKFCPCCGTFLRTRPHSREGKEDWQKRLRKKVTRH